MIKEPKTHYQSEEEKQKFWKEFTNEAVVSSLIGDHPCIAKFVGVCIDDKYPAALLFLFKSGGNVENALLQNHRYWSDKLEDVRKVMIMAWQAAEGISYLHQKKVIHGDIACRNMLLDGDDNLRFLI